MKEREAEEENEKRYSQIQKVIHTTLSIAILPLLIILDPSSLIHHFSDLDPNKSLDQSTHL